MRYRSYLIFFFGFLAVCLLYAPLPAQAFIRVTPTIIDLKGKPRDGVRTTIKIENLDDARWTIYGFDTSKDAGDPTDKTRSLLPWLQYNHALEIAPRTTTELELKVQVYPFAIPGFYHANLTLVPAASTRGEAESTISTRGKTVSLNFEVKDDAVEGLELSNFRSEAQFTKKLPVVFLTHVRNVGNRDVHLEGTIRVSDRSGNEVKSLSLEPFTIRQGESQILRTEWAGPASLGKYKAYLALRYGERMELVQDNTFFWLLDTPLLLALFAVGLLIALVIAYVLHLHLGKSEE